MKRINITFTILFLALFLSACSNESDKEDIKGIVHLNGENFENIVLKNDKPVLVDFWAVWCAPCKMQAPILKDLSTEYEDRIQIAKVDVDQNRGLAAEYRITGIPTLLIFVDGKIEERLVGFQAKEKLKIEFEKILKEEI